MKLFDEGLDAKSYIHEDNKYFHTLQGLFFMEEDFRGYETVLLKFLTNQDAYEKWCADNHPD